MCQEEKLKLAERGDEANPAPVRRNKLYTNHAAIPEYSTPDESATPSTGAAGSYRYPGPSLSPLRPIVAIPPGNRTSQPM